MKAGMDYVGVKGDRNTIYPFLDLRLSYATIPRVGSISTSVLFDSGAVHDRY
jgi:hypothetical protein